MHFASVTSIVHRGAVVRSDSSSSTRRCRREPLLLVIIVISHPKRCGYAKRCGQSRRAEQSARVLSEAPAAGVERDRRHVALSLRTRQSSARVRRALARPSSRVSGGGARFELKGALTWPATSSSAATTLASIYFLAFATSSIIVAVITDLFLVSSINLVKFPL